MPIAGISSGKPRLVTRRLDAPAARISCAEHQDRAIAAAMTHVDDSAEPRLERILSEMRQEARTPR